MIFLWKWQTGYCSVLKKTKNELRSLSRCDEVEMGFPVARLIAALDLKRHCKLGAVSAD
jgi:hypothetical protein